MNLLLIKKITFIMLLYLLQKYHIIFGGGLYLSSIFVTSPQFHSYFLSGRTFQVCSPHKLFQSLHCRILLFAFNIFMSGYSYLPLSSFLLTSVLFSHNLMFYLIFEEDNIFLNFIKLIKQMSSIIYFFSPHKRFSIVWCQLVNKVSGFASLQYLSLSHCYSKSF